MYDLKYFKSIEQKFMSEITNIYLNLFVMKEKNNLNLKSTLIVNVLDFSQSSSIKRHIQYVTNLKNLEDLNFVISYFAIKILK